jgi:hypothetical protein
VGGGGGSESKLEREEREGECKRASERERDRTKKRARETSRETERENDRDIERERESSREREENEKERERDEEQTRQKERERVSEIVNEREQRGSESEQARYIQRERLIQSDRATESGTHPLADAAHQRIPANHCQKISPANPCQQRTSEFLPAAKPREFLPAEQTHASGVALQDPHQRLRSPHTRIPARDFFGAARSSGGREPAGSWAPKFSRESRTRPDLSSHASCTQPASPSQPAASIPAPSWLCLIEWSLRGESLVPRARTTQLRVRQTLPRGTVSPLVLPVPVSVRPSSWCQPAVPLRALGQATAIAVAGRESTRPTSHSAAAAALPSARDRRRRRRRSGRERDPSCERASAHPQRSAAIFRDPRSAILFGAVVLCIFYFRSSFNFNGRAVRFAENGVLFVCEGGPNEPPAAPAGSLVQTRIQVAFNPPQCSHRRGVRF